jgi:hypothetical protein
MKNKFSGKIFHILSLIVFSLLLMGFFPRYLFTQTQIQKCTICHGKKDFKVQLDDGSVRNLFVEEKLLKESPHYNNNCTDCHNDIVEITAVGHTKNVKKVQCTRCHFENNPVGAPETQMYKDFQESIHQQEFLKGNPKAPVCQSCHGSHDIKYRKSLSSVELKKKISKMCGQCHLDIYSSYSTSIHGVALFDKNSPDVPACSDCHGEHKIRGHEDPGSSVFSTKIYNTCGNCHASASIVEKYGIKSDKFQTYESSFHGIAMQFGEKTAANCASCHGVHDIKSQNDPTSSIHSNNIVKTCGKCHPDANANYTKGKIHLNPHSEEAGSIYYIGSFFKWLTIITLSFLFIHIMLDLIRKIKLKKAGK